MPFLVKIHTHMNPSNFISNSWGATGTVFTAENLQIFRPFVYTTTRGLLLSWKLPYMRRKTCATSSIKQSSRKRGILSILVSLNLMSVAFDVRVALTGSHSKVFSPSTDLCWRERESTVCVLNFRLTYVGWTWGGLVNSLWCWKRATLVDICYLHACCVAVEPEKMNLQTTVSEL